MKLHVSEINGNISLWNAKPNVSLELSLQMIDNSMCIIYFPHQFVEKVKTKKKSYLWENMHLQFIVQYIVVKMGAF